MAIKKVEKSKGFVDFPESDEELAKMGLSKSTTPRPLADMYGTLRSKNGMVIVPGLVSENLEESPESGSVITSTHTASGAGLIFEKSDGPTFFVNAIPETDSSKRRIMVMMNDEPFDPGTIRKRETTSKDAATALGKWGGKAKEQGILSDFLQGKLRTVDIDEEMKRGLGVDTTGVAKAYAEQSKRKTTSK